MGGWIFQEQLHIIQKLYRFLSTYTTEFYKPRLRCVVGIFFICSAKLSLSCNDHLIRVKYSEEYKVFKNFSLSYQMKHYDYREYRLNDDAFERCASNDSRVQAIWKTRNSWVKGYIDYSCSGAAYTLKKFSYVIGYQFNVFIAVSAQSFKNMIIWCIMEN